MDCDVKPPRAVLDEITVTMNTPTNSGIADEYYIKSEPTEYDTVVPVKDTLVFKEESEDLASNENIVPDKVTTQLQQIKQENYNQNKKNYEINDLNDCDFSSDTIISKDGLDTLYENHIIKNEMTIGPEVLQPAANLTTRDRICFQDNDDIEMENKLSPASICEYVDKKNRKKEKKSSTKIYNDKGKLDKQSDSYCAKKFICDYCQKQVARKEQMVHHMKQVHAKLKKYPKEYGAYDQCCLHCNKKFRLEESLKKHMEIHMETGAIGSHQCGVCCQDFTNEYNLERHTLIHLGITKPSYACDKCDKVYLKKDSLNLHNDRDHLGILTPKKSQRRPRRPPQPITTCDYCQKTFRFKQHLKQHIMSHMGLRKVTKVYVKKKAQCDVCNKIYSNNHALSIHKDTVHLKLFKYFCSKCKHGTNRKWLLNKHEMVCGLGRKPRKPSKKQVGDKYACKLCPSPMLYKTSVGLKLHIESVHLNIKYSCEKCMQTFTRVGTLQLHGPKCKAQNK